jgi:hypothetical protein
MRPYRAYTLDQAFLVPPALTDWLDDDDPVFFLRDVLARLDLSAFHAAYRCERGQPPYHPALMLGIYFWGDATPLLVPPIGRRLPQGHRLHGPDGPHDA